MQQPMPVQSSVPGNDSELGEFLLRACHDLRGPLRAIRAHAELFQKEVEARPGAEPPKSIEFIVGGAMQAGVLIDGLADFSLALQIDTGAFQPVPLGVMFRVVLAKLAKQIQDANAEITYDALPTVHGNADRIMQLFEHLLDYSIRRRGAEPLRIQLSAVNPGEFWLFRLCDNNIALEKAYLEKIFKPFERLTGKERPGPGLAICRVIVERHGGRMWAEDDSAGSTVFCFTLPA